MPENHVALRENRYLFTLQYVVMYETSTDHRLYTPYGCETAARANRFIMECQCRYAGFAPLTFSFVNVSNSS